MVNCTGSELQIRRGNKDKFGIIHIFPLKIFCDPSLELSHRDSSNEESEQGPVVQN